MAEAPQSVRMSTDELFAQFERHKRLLTQLESRRTEFQNLLGEQEGAFTALDALEKAEEGDTVLMPLGGGVFVDVKVIDRKKVKKTTVPDIVVEADMGSVKTEMLNRSKELSKSLEKLLQEEERLLTNLKGLEQLIRMVTRRQQEKRADGSTKA